MTPIRWRTGQIGRTKFARDRPETAAWHFVDIPVSAASYDPTRDANGGANIIDAIERNEKILADRSANKVARAEALSFVTHLVGDVHQPLHAADRDHDKGGNLRLVYLLDQSKSLNLHSAWDSAILKTELGRTSDTVFASSLNARISKAEAEKWSQGSLVDWVNESHELAVNVVYAGIPERGPLPHLDRTYVDHALLVINGQLSRGGVRLAEELNRLLSPGVAEPSKAQPATTQSIDAHTPATRPSSATTQP